MSDMGENNHAVQPRGVKRDLLLFARWATLGACVGGLVGVVLGGVGGRLAMLLLRFTSEDYIRGLESDDGFIMGRFTFDGTLSLLFVTAILGAIGGLIVVLGRPFLPPRYTLAGWPIAAGAIVGSIIIRSDGVDFTLLAPKLLAIAMFIAIPAAGAFLIAWIIERWDAWWWTDWKRTVPALVPGLPALVVFPIPIAAVVLGVVWVAALQVEGVRELGTARPVQALAMGVFAALTGLGLFALTRDVSEIL